MLQLHRRWWHGLWSARNQWHIVCEMATRRFVARLQDIEEQTGCPLVIAGGFATWQCVHEQALLHRGIWPDRLWVPDNIDVFTPRCRFTKEVERLVRAAYSWFFRILHVMCVADTEPICIKSETVRGKAADDADISLLRDAVDDVAVNPNVGKFLHEIIGHAPDRALDRVCVMETMLLSGVLPPKRIPSTHGHIAHELKIVMTRDPVPSQPPQPADSNRLYTQWLLDGFDLTHSAVALRIDCETGTWRFFHAETTRFCINSMTLRFQANRVVNAHDTLRRACKYIMYGFSAGGRQ